MGIAAYDTKKVNAVMEAVENTPRKKYLTRFMLCVNICIDDKKNPILLTYHLYIFVK